MAQAIDRVHYIWNNILTERNNGGVSLARARLVTESWKQTSMYPQPIRRGLAVKHILENIPLFIDDEQLFCGSYSSKSMWGEWYPEYESKFLLNADDDEPALQKMSRNPEDKDEIRQIAAFWSELSIEDQFEHYLSPEDRAVLLLMDEDHAHCGAVNAARARQGGYYCVNIEKVIKKGLKGVIEEIDEQLAKLEINGHEALRKSQNLQGWKYALQGGIAYGHRCAQLCRDTANKISDPIRKAELLMMAKVCDQVPENPARTFHEALQATYFVQIFIYLESRGDGVSPGRVDQYTYPCYKSDREKGALTDEQAIELINCFRIKFNTFRQLSSKSFMNTTSGEAQFHNITLGGTDRYGNSAVNEVSYLFLEAALRLRMPHPTLSVRYFDQIPKEFLDKALQVVAQGGGYPAFFNDKAQIGTMVRYGVALEDARDYALGGCVQAMAAGMTAPGYPVFMNFGKCMELAIYDGFDEFKSKAQIGPHTGKLSDFKTFDEFYNAFKQQVVYCSSIISKYSLIQRSIRDSLASCGFTDALIDGCIESGMTSSGSGAKYNMQYHCPIGMINVADSLTAIKKCVFEDRTVSPDLLIDALKANFAGYENVHELLSAAPKYGNDDDYADNMAYDVYHWWSEMVNETFEAGFGTHYLPGSYSVSNHTPMGHNTGALPDGRYAGEALADGSVSPRQGVDFCGPTAVLNSAIKINQDEMITTLLNVKFQENTFTDDKDRAKLAMLIKTYFNGGGKHIQFNVVSKSTLIDAQIAPERHRDLIVRVAGYSAFFVELVPTLQKEIITRTENEI